MDLQGKTALVTGGAVRLGRAICEALAGRGCNLAVHHYHSTDAAADLAEELARFDVTVVPVRRRLGSEADCELLVNEARQAAGPLDILVNNAAVYHRDALAAVTEAKLLDELRINSLVPVLLTRVFAAAIEGGRQDRGQIVNLLDARVAGNHTGCLPYLLSKKMLADFTRCAALELAPSVTVNAVAPGPVLAPPGENDTRLRALVRDSPLGRACGPQDVARAVIFLLESDVITGQTIFVDSGSHLL
jgi:NAD(P)-dependent dehydrogenase (short-subunit alcohol dehydrogenase family)